MIFALFSMLSMIFSSETINLFPALHNGHAMTVGVLMIAIVGLCGLLYHGRNLIRPPIY